MISVYAAASLSAPRPVPAKTTPAPGTASAWRRRADSRRAPVPVRAAIVDGLRPLAGRKSRQPPHGASHPRHRLVGARQSRIRRQHRRIERREKRQRRQHIARPRNPRDLRHDAAPRNSARPAAAGRRARAWWLHPAGRHTSAAATGNRKSRKPVLRALASRRRPSPPARCSWDRCPVGRHETRGPAAAILGAYTAGTAITGTCPRRFNSSAIAISGLISPNVPIFERTMRTKKGPGLVWSAP